jgi:hypothetical protein
LQKESLLSFFGYEVGVDRVSRLVRIWSNKELQRFAPFFKSDVVNVSAWKDEDKEGGYYRNYFKAATSYNLTNWHGGRGAQYLAGEILLDLETSLPEHLVGRFDVVFNHTTLEHTFDVFLAFRNLCLLSRDVVIVIVPCLQPVHFEEGYSDYWRFTTYTLRKLCEQNEMSVIYESVSPYQENASIYLFCVASKHPERWASVLPAQKLDDTFIKSVGSHIIRNDPLTHLFTIIYRVAYRVFRWLKQLVSRTAMRS